MAKKDDEFTLTGDYPYFEHNGLDDNSSLYSINASGTIANGGYITGGTGLTYNGALTSTGAGAGWVTTASPTTSGKIMLTGDNADIDINGKSLLATLNAIEERLNIVTPNLAIEAEWQELKELGDKYRQLEQDIKEKLELWGLLKKMPPPDIK